MRTIVTLTIVLACASLAAQTNYYMKTRTFAMEGYTYQCDVLDTKMIMLYIYKHS